jgi:hypothetical protein
MSFLVNIAYAIAGEGAAGDVALTFSFDRKIRWGWHARFSFGFEYGLFLV